MAKKRISKRQVQTAVKRAHDARLAVRRKMEGKIYAEIAAELGTSVTRVCVLINEQKQSWQDDARQDTQAWMLDAIAQYRRLAEEAWQEWQRSKQPKEVKETGTNDKGIYRKRRREGQTGNPAYLATIRDCIEGEGRLRGVYRTDINFNQQINVTGVEDAREEAASMAASVLPPSLVYQQIRQQIEQLPDDSDSEPNTDDDSRQDA